MLARLAEDFVKDISLSDAMAVLDLGAGTGTLLRHLIGRTAATLVGVDRSHGMLTLSPETLRAVMDAERLAFKDETFDIAFAMFILFHLPSPVTGLTEIRRVLREGGTVAFTTWGDDDDPDFRAFEVFDEVLDRHGAAAGRGLYSNFDLSDTPEKCAALLEMPCWKRGERPLPSSRRKRWC